jgi:hypothetical protein
MPRPGSFIENLGSKWFWLLFGGIWFIVGTTFVFFPTQGSKDEWIMRLIGAPFALIGGGIVAWSIRKAYCVGQIMESGIRCEATVTEVTATNFSVNRVPQWVIRFSFQDYQGQQRTGESDYMSPQDAQEWKAGDRGSVRYDQQDPKACVWVGREIT